MPEKIAVPVPEMPETFARTNSRGLIEIVDMHTNRVVAVQSSVHDYLQAKWDNLIKIDTPQGPVWIEKGLDIGLAYKVKAVPFSQVVADLICEAIVNGSSLKKAIGKISPDLDYATICRWKRDHPEFKLELEQAQKDRTESQHDEILQIAAEKGRPSTQIEALKWSAEKNNPEKFGNKTKIQGDPNAPVVFQINTGIDRGAAGGPSEQTPTPGVPAEREAQKIESDIPEIPE
jgi:hypothetical protein